MRRLRFSLILALLFLAVPLTAKAFSLFDQPGSDVDQKEVCDFPPAFCTSPYAYGDYWNSLRGFEKEKIIHGAQIGLLSAWQIDSLEGNEGGSMRPALLDRGQNIVEVYSGQNIKQLAEYFDRLYNDPANRAIDWTYALMLATLAEQEQNPEGAAKSQEAYFKAFLRQYGELPVYAHIIKVLTPDMLEVEVLLPEPYRLPLKLRGIDIEGLDEPAQARAQKFIEGLNATRGYPFENCTCTDMVRPQLIYGAKLFTDDGKLQAYLRFNENSFCLAKGEVQASDLQGGEGNNRGLNLNDILLRFGLAKVAEAELDAEEAAALRATQSYAIGKKYYLQGGAKNPAVEKVLKQGPKPLNQNCLP